METNWINFETNLKSIPWQSWVELGECAAKCEQIRTIPLKPHVKQHLHLIYLAKGVHATTAIEGNTLSEEQIKDLINNKLKLPPSKEYLENEARNIIEACNEIAVQVAQGSFKEISVSRLCHYNNKVLQNVPCDETVIPGEIRKHNVVVGNVYRAPDAKDVSALITKFCEWMNSDYFTNQQRPVHFAIIKAIAAHLYIAWIHPFGDGNGRVARLLEFAILLNSGIASPAAHLLSNHYNMTRSEYYRRLNKASKTGDPTEFFSYAIQGFRDGLTEQLQHIQRHVMDTCWREYIYEYFREIVKSATMRRRRELILKISESKQPVEKDALLMLMSKEYKDKSERTFLRDLKDLEKIELIVNDGGKYLANKSLMLQYLPFSTLQ